jgi:hypothetical protein
MRRRRTRSTSSEEQLGHVWLTVCTGMTQTLSSLDTRGSPGPTYNTGHGPGKV